MGRQQYLTRLALGRSAFQDPDQGSDNQADLDEKPGRDNASNDPDGDQYIQQYDAKGRPINPATEARNSAMRKAQNSVLALVGVVEGRENREKLDDLKFRYIARARQEVLETEDEAGEALDVIASLGAPLLCWWANCLLQRFQAGVYNSGTPFTQVLHSEWKALVSGGLKAAFATALPGAPAYILLMGVRFAMTAAIEEGAKLLSEYLWGHLSKRSSRRFDRILRFGSIALVVVGEAVTLPLLYYAVAQCIGVAPAFPLLPPLSSYIPGGLPSIYSLAWQPLIQTPVLRWLSSPAALLMISSTFKTEAYEPIMTSFHTPGITDPIFPVKQPPAMRDPLGWVMHKCYLARRGLLQYCGWRSPDSRGERQHEASLSLDQDESGRVTTRIYRSTTLSHLLPEFVANMVDELFATLLLMPLESLTLRAVAQSHLASPLLQTPTGLTAAHSLHMPFGGSPLSHLIFSGGSMARWTSLGEYVGKIGLCLTVKLGFQVAIFASLYSVVRWQGTQYFDWGSTCRIGGIWYSPSSAVR